MDYPTLAPGQPVKLFEGNWLHDVYVTGHSVGFVSIMHGSASRIVRRHQLYAFPGERARLQQDIQTAINQLGSLHDRLPRFKDPIPFQQDSA